MEFVGKLELNKKLDKDMFNLLKLLNDKENFISKVNAGDNNFHECDNYFYWHKCRWRLSGDDMQIIPYEIEDIRHYDLSWLAYICKYVLSQKKYTLNGVIKYKGKPYTNFGEIIVEDNTVFHFPSYNLNRKEVVI